MKTDQWNAFKAKARSDGQLIENVIKDVYLSTLSKSSCALDGGAHVGFHTLPLSQHLTDGKVIAVEANRKTFARLKKNTEGARNVVLTHAALQNDESRLTVTFNCSTSHPGRSGLNRLWDIIAPGQVTYEPEDTVPAVTIDRVVRDNSLNRLDFIKLDLEGGEFNALRGATKTMRELRPLIVTEHSSQASELHGYTMQEYFSLLAGMRYTPVAPNGQVVDMSEPVPFWYVFLVPSDRVAEFSTQLEASMSKSF